MPKFTPSVNEITEKAPKLLRKYIKISRHFLKKIPPIATNFNSATALSKNILDVMKKGTSPDVPDWVCRVQGASQTWSGLIIKMPCFLKVFKEWISLWGYFSFSAV